MEEDSRVNYINIHVSRPFVDGVAKVMSHVRSVSLRTFEENEMHFNLDKETSSTLLIE